MQPLSGFGKIADMTTSVKREAGPLKQELFIMGKFVGKVTFGLSIFVFIIQIFLGFNHGNILKLILSSLIFSVALAVAAVSHPRQDTQGRTDGN